MGKRREVFLERALLQAIKLASIRVTDFGPFCEEGEPKYVVGYDGSVPADDMEELAEFLNDLPPVMNPLDSGFNWDQPSEPRILRECEAEDA